MAQVLVTESYLDDIADAIRDKTGSEDTYTPGQMAGAINGIHTADEVVLVSKSISANGTYNPASDSADGYSGVTVNVPNTYTVSDNGKVVVNQALTDQTSKSINANGTHDTTANNSVVVDVPNSYAAADEGKVVSGGALVGQTSRNVTANGTYDTTTNNEVVVNVSGGGGGTGGDPIPFIVTVSSTYNSAYSAQNAFNDSGFWGANGGTTEWLKLQFNDPVKITAIKFGNTFIVGNLHWTSSRITFQASNDGTTWVDLYDATNLSDSPDNYYEYLLQNNNEYIYYRFLCYKGSYYACIGKIKLSFENGGGSNDAFAEFDFRKLTGTIRNVTYGTSGAVFDNTSNYILMPIGKSDMTIEIDVGQMQLSSGDHRRFVMGDGENGFIYRSSGVWAFYAGSTWENFAETDGSLFANSTVKVYVDTSNKWHIYKDGVLFFEPTKALALNAGTGIYSNIWYIGSPSGQTINNAVIKAIRLYDGEYTG